jgi:hypothetical protein
MNSRRQITDTTIATLLLFLPLAMVPATARSGRNHLSASAAAATIVDTLGAATPSTEFSALGTGGISILATQFVGPEFTLIEQTRIVEIGGFVSNRGGFVEGVPQCPSPPPLSVQVRAAKNGTPDPSSIVASFMLSNDDDPFLVSYESVQPNLVLAPGTYFALFATQRADAGGFLLQSATSPFQYLSGSTQMGFLDVTTGNASASVSAGAVRILGFSTILDTCIQDDSNGNLLELNSTTGDYHFTVCANGIVTGGTGALIVKGSLITLQHYASDRRVLAKIDNSVKKATASIQVFALGNTFTIADRNTMNNTCVCP